MGVISCEALFTFQIDRIQLESAMSDISGCPDQFWDMNQIRFSERGLRFSCSYLFSTDEYVVKTW